MSDHTDPPPFAEIAQRGRARERRRRTLLGGTAVVALLTLGVLGWQALERDETSLLTPADTPTTTTVGEIVGMGGRTCADVERDAASGTTTTTPEPPLTLNPSSTDAEVAAWTAANSRDGSDLRVDSDDDQTHASIVTGAGERRTTLYSAPPDASITAIHQVAGSVYFVLAGADGKSSLRRFDLDDGTAGTPTVALPEVRTRFFRVSPDESQVAWIDDDWQHLVITSLDGGARRSMQYGFDSIGDNFGWDHTSTHLWIQLDRAPVWVDCRTGVPLSGIGDGSPHELQTEPWIEIGWISSDVSTLDGALRFDTAGLVLATFDHAGSEVVAVHASTSPEDTADLVDPRTGRSLEETARPIASELDTSPDFTFRGEPWAVDD